MEENMKKCRFCGEEIRAEAVKCKHCGQFLEGAAPPVAPPLPTERRGTGSMIACFVVAAAAVLIGAVLVLGVLAAILIPALSNAREEAQRAKCRMNLRQIGISLQMYASDFSGELPADLSQLSPQYISSPSALVCPSVKRTSGGAAPVAPSLPDYVYIPPGVPIPQVTTPKGATVLCYDRPGNHRNGSNVLYLDGHVAWQQGFTPPKPPAAKAAR